MNKATASLFVTSRGEINNYFFIKQNDNIPKSRNSVDSTIVDATVHEQTPVSHSVSSFESLPGHFNGFSFFSSKVCIQKTRGKRKSF